MTAPHFIIYEFPNGTISLLLDVQVVFIFFLLSEKKARMSFLGHNLVQISISSEYMRRLILT